MIQLCYVNEKITPDILVLFICHELLPIIEPEDNLVIISSRDLLEDCKYYISKMEVSNNSKYFHNKRWIQLNSMSNTVDLEKISNQKLKNIILINFDSLYSSILRSLIHNSKKTEIVGISIDHTEYFKNIQIEIEKYKEQGYSDDQLIVMLVLKYNCPSSMITECLNNIRFKTSNVKLRTIDSLQNILNLLK